MRISLFDSDAVAAPFHSQIAERLAEVAQRGTYILGPEVRAFEEEFASYLGVRHVVGVANGTDAITIALRALGVRPGDEVVVPSFTFYASAEAIATAGARPIFCDVDLETRNVTAETVRAALSSRTRAVLAVDLFGCPAPIPEIRELGVPVLEDAAQAAGAGLGPKRAGALGDVATFSFYPSKNLPCFGDGGAITTDDDAIAELARTLRFHGSRDKQTFVAVGYNSRLDELQAAILRLLLPHLDGWSEGRRQAGDAYRDAGLGDLVGLPAGPPGARPAWHLFVVTHPSADELIAGLRELGIESRGYYRVPTHEQPAMSPFRSSSPELTATEELARTNLALPLSPAPERSRVGEVVEAVQQVLANQTLAIEP